ncbi:MAG: sigma 54-interacting transcriptional regulator [Thermodesulfobacteriota bacterium]
MDVPDDNSLDCLLSDQYIHLLDRLNLPAFTVDLSKRITAINNSLAALLEMDEAQVLGRPCRAVFRGLPCEADCPFQKAWDPIQDAREVQVFDAGGQRHQVTRLAAPLVGPSRELAGCVVILQDQPPLAQLIHRVEHDARNLKMTLDNLNIGIFTVNRGGHVTFFNAAAEIISGFKRDQVLGRPASVIFAGEENGDLACLKEAMAKGQPRPGLKTRITTPDGEVVPVRADYLPLINELGRTMGGLATLEDLTLAERYDQTVADRCTFDQMVGRDPAMQKVFATVQAVAATGSTILIEGATGTGKDLLAKIIHSLSQRRQGPWVKVNCAAIPENLIESELFGYVRGAFTGADRNKPGRFQEAHGGTIFLDEIGELPWPMQAKLLRVLDDQEFYPLGGRRTFQVDVRVISATNRRLERLVASGHFREDLYYRLNVVHIELPDLKDRRADLPLLIKHILRRLGAGRGRKTPGLSAEAMALLLAYDYPGNVRELENILEQALIICHEDTIGPQHFSGCLRVPSPAGRPVRRPPQADQIGVADGRDRILDMLHRHHWHRKKTALALGMDRTTLWRKMKRLGLSP